MQSLILIFPYNKFSNSDIEDKHGLNQHKFCIKEYLKHFKYFQVHIVTQTRLAKCFLC